jgi:hypothetical protein
MCTVWVLLTIQLTIQPVFEATHKTREIDRKAWNHLECQIVRILHMTVIIYSIEKVFNFMNILHNFWMTALTNSAKSTTIFGKFQLDRRYYHGAWSRQSLKQSSFTLRRIFLYTEQIAIRYIVYNWLPNTSYIRTRNYLKINDPQKKSLLKTITFKLWKCCENCESIPTTIKG